MEQENEVLGLGFANAKLPKEERQLIINNILEIQDENKNKLENINLNLLFSQLKKKTSIWHLELNNKNLSKKDKYLIKYKCYTCNSIHIVGTTQFLRKINKCSLNCYLCRNNNEINHSNKLKELNIIKKELKEDSILDISIIEFNKYDDDYKDDYFKFHLTNDEYKRISKNIISFQNGKYSDISNIEYCPILKTNNQMKFTSIMYDTINKTMFKAHQPILKCDNCCKEWRAKSIERFKNCIKILCNECTLCNRTFKIRNTKNINNENILYQSKLELKFIDWCNNNNIIVNNGPSIKYTFENKERIYKVDFAIKDSLIEIKDNHIWHKQDIKTGKWNAKENAVKEFIKDNLIYKNYLLIFPNNWNLMLQNILKLNKI